MPQNIMALIGDSRYSARNLTLREQARLADNPNELRYRTLFPVSATDSIKMSEITRSDLRLVADRREWNAQPRTLHEVYGPAREWEIMPIGADFPIDERKMNLLVDPNAGVLAERDVFKLLDEWPTTLTDAVDRRLEIEAFEAWQSGTITAYDPKRGGSVTADLGIAADRLVAEAIAWTDAGVNGYERFLAHMQETEQKFGGVAAEAVRLRRAMLQLLRAEAKAYYETTEPMTAERLREMVVAEGFSGFAGFVVDERTLDPYTDAGFTTASTKLVQDSKLLFQPTGGRIGATYMAPTVSAYEFTGDGERNVAQNIVVLYHSENGGKTLRMEATANAAPMPDERAVYVVDAGAPA